MNGAVGLVGVREQDGLRGPAQDIVIQRGLGGTADEEFLRGLTDGSVNGSAAPCQWPDSEPNVGSTETVADEKEPVDPTGPP